MYKDICVYIKINQPGNYFILKQSDRLLLAGPVDDDYKAKILLSA